MSAHGARHAARWQARAIGALGAASFVAAALMAGALALLTSGELNGGAILQAGNEPPSPLAQSEVPPRYLALYRRAAQRYGVDWAVLAAIGKVECDHGRDPDPACTQEGATNSAGAGGPMQFIATTWSRYGVDANGDGRADRWSPEDAIYSAANYLRASGAPRDYKTAIYAYNHAGWYVAEVLRLAARYRSSSRETSLALPSGSVGLQLGGESPAAATPTRVSFIAGSRAVLSSADGHVALVPLQAPAPVQAMVVAGNELQSLRYGPGGHPDPRGAAEEDCSSSLNYVLYRSGIRPIAEIVRANPLAADYVHWGAPGPGRFVTIYAASSHVFVVVAGLRLDTSHDGTDVGPNRAEDGPRWRVLDGIPTWARWSVRHPPGL